MPEDPESRRAFLGGIFTSAGKVVSRRVGQIAREPSPTQSADSYHSLLRPPDSIRVLSAGSWIPLEQFRGGVWSSDSAMVRTQMQTGALSISMEASEAPVGAVEVRWRADVKGVRRYLSLGSGRQEWRSEIPDRAMPGRFASHDGKRTHNYGVHPKPGAFAHWFADRHGMTLYLDLRSGDRGVELADRELQVCTVSCREGSPDETAFQAIRGFNAQICPHPRLPAQPMYGLHCQDGNLAVRARITAELAPNSPNRPFVIVPFDKVEDVFDVVGLARDLGLRPGISLPTHRDEEIALDQFKQLAEAGVELFHCLMTKPHVSPDPSRTNAEAMVEMFTAIRSAVGQSYLSVEAGDEMMGAGLVERVTRAGNLLDQVNSIGFLGAANGLLAGIDPGPIHVDQSLHNGPSRQLVELASKSGCPFFVQLESEDLSVGDWTILRDALETAALEHEQAEPLDWISTTVPSRWLASGERITCDWVENEGFSPMF